MVEAVVVGADSSPGDFMKESTMRMLVRQGRMRLGYFVIPMILGAFFGCSHGMRDSFALGACGGHGEVGHGFDDLYVGVEGISCDASSVNKFGVGRVSVKLRLCGRGDAQFDALMYLHGPEYSTVGGLFEIRDGEGEAIALQNAPEQRPEMIVFSQCYFGDLPPVKNPEEDQFHQSGGWIEIPVMEEMQVGERYQIRINPEIAQFILFEESESPKKVVVDEGWGEFVLQGGRVNSAVIKGAVIGVQGASQEMKEAAPDGTESVIAVPGEQSGAAMAIAESELGQADPDEIVKRLLGKSKSITLSNPSYPPGGLVLTRYVAPEYLEARIREANPQFSQEPRAKDAICYPIGLRTKYVYDLYMSRAWYVEIDLIYEGPEEEVLSAADSMMGKMGDLPEVWIEIRDEDGMPLKFPPPLRERTDMSTSIHYTRAGFYREELGEGKIRLLEPYGVALAEKPEPGIYTVRLLSSGPDLEKMQRQGFGSFPVTLTDDSWHTFALEYASLERGPRKASEASVESNGHSK